MGLAFKDHPSLPVRTLHLDGLATGAGREVLVAWGLSEADPDLDRLLELYSGNPYALKVVASTIIALFNGQISKFLEQEQMIYGDIRRLLEQQVNRCPLADKDLFHCLARCSDWVSLSDMEQNLPEVEAKRLLLETLESLDHRGFIENSMPDLDCRVYCKSICAVVLTQNPLENKDHELECECDSGNCGTLEYNCHCCVLGLCCASDQAKILAQHGISLYKFECS